LILIFKSSLVAFHDFKEEKAKEVHMSNHTRREILVAAVAGTIYTAFSPIRAWLPIHVWSITRSCRHARIFPANAPTAEWFGPCGPGHGLHLKIPMMS
jgi:hypothetical protein